jgi:hypothetical protein
MLPSDHDKVMRALQKALGALEQAERALLEPLLDHSLITDLAAWEARAADPVNAFSDRMQAQRDGAPNPLRPA